MADVLITENITGSPIEELKGKYPVSFQPDLWKDRAGLLSAVRTVRALVVRNQTQVNAELIAAAERLEVIARAGVGLDNVDVRAASAAGVVVAMTPSQNSLSVAELTLGLMLALARKIAAADRHVKASHWARHQFMGSELCGKTLGVVGFGRIGSLVARRAAAFEMQILAYDPYLAPGVKTVGEARVEIVPLEQVLAQSDFVSCNVPATEQTRAMFNYCRFCQMRPTAVLINVARGEVVDEAGLIQALRERRIAGAALDVRAKEPPEPGPLSEMDNVILTPHIAGFTHEAQHRVVAAVSRDVAAVLSGGEAVDYANFSRPQKNRPATA